MCLGNFCVRNVCTIHQLLSRELSGFFRTFCVHDIHTISQLPNTGFSGHFVCEAYVPFTNYQVGDYPVSSKDFCARDVHTMLYKQ